MPDILFAALGIGILFAAIKLFSAPMRLVFKILVNTGLGFALLLLFNLMGDRFGMSIGLNIFNVLFVAVFGLPGFALLLTAQLLFR